MSLRIIVKTDQIQNWIETRGGTPARRNGTDSDVAVLFGETNAEFEPLSVDELIEAMKANRLVMLVDQEAGKTFHKFVRHS